MQVNALVSMYNYFSSKLVVCIARDALGTLLMVVLSFGKLRSKNIIQEICLLVSLKFWSHYVRGNESILHFLRFRLLEGETIEFKQYGLHDNVAQLSLFEVGHPHR